MLRRYSTKKAAAPFLGKKTGLQPAPLPFKATDLLRSSLNNNTSGNTSGRRPNYKVENYKINRLKEKEIDIGTNFSTIVPEDIIYEPLPSPTPLEVPQLEHNLDRVLFSPGVHFLQDPRTRVFNFTPFLKQIMPLSKFDFNKISQYITLSKDQTLLKIAQDLNLKFFSSTSSMTSALTQFHFWLSNDRPANIVNLSKNFHGLGATFTSGTRCPTVLMCKKQSDLCYSVDADKSSDKQLLLSLLGHSMEKLLTTSPKMFNKYHINNSHQLTPEEINKPESYHYLRIGDFLMRSQLDCHDARLPGTGTFDLKTRAVCAVRHDISHTEKHLTGYKIFKNNGLYESFEREFYELIRSALLKYSLQARIGNMDGIFVCYHNIQQIFGFQYLSLLDIDYIFHSFDDQLHYKDSNNFRPHGKLDVEKIQGPIGDDLEDLQMKMSSHILDQEFKASVDIWSTVLKAIEKELKGQSFRLVLKNDPVDKVLYCILTPISNERIDEIQKLGDKTSSDEVAATDSEIQKQHQLHRQQFQLINEETAHKAVGFSLVRKHYFNGQESNQVYYRPGSLTEKWEIRYQMSKVKKKTAQELYLKFLKEKEKIVWGDDEENDDLNEQIQEYLKILRAYGDKGKLREQIWREKDDKLTVWEPIQNDRNI